MTTSSTKRSNALPQQVSVKDVERLLTQVHSVKNVEIDARQVQAISMYSVSLLAAWLRSLKAEGKDVRVLMPPLDALIADARRIFVDRGFLHLLTEAGIESDYTAALPEGTIGVGTITPETDRSALITSTATHLQSILETPSADMFIGDMTHTVLFELIDNAVVHAGAAQAYFGVDVISAADIINDTFLPSFHAAQQYIDVVVGDSGCGLLRQLATLMPTDYVPPFQTSHHFKRDERVLSYAFEFGSTSNEDARRERLEALLGSDIDPRRVATGLACVLNVVRQRHGSMIVRSGRGVLAVDYSRGWEGTPAIMGSADLGLKGLRDLAGTHYVLRFPVVRLTVRRGAATVLSESTLIDGLRVIDPWVGLRDRSERDVLADAVHRVDSEVRIHRGDAGVTILRRSPRRMSSRAKALFGATLTSLHRGIRHVVCLDDYFAAFDTAHPDLGDDYLPATESGSILFGDLFRNEFQEVQWGGARVPPHLAEAAAGHVRLTVRLRDAVIKLYSRSLLQELQIALRQPHVRLEGKFDIDHRYVTTVFYAVSSVLDDPRSRQRFAEWALPNIPDDCDILVVAAAPVMSLVAAIADLYSLRGRRFRVMDLSSSEIVPGAILRYAGQRAVLFTDVICTSRTISRILAELGPLSLRRVITVVDARRQDEVGGDLVAGDMVLPLTSVVQDAVVPLASGESLSPPPQGQLHLLLDRRRVDAVMPVIDRETHRPTVHVRPVATRLTTQELISAATRSGALRYGHSEYANRHYSVFLHLPRLFGELRTLMENWIGSVIGAVTPSASASWRVIILAVDASFSWAVDYCAALLPDARIDEVTWNHLRAPDPPRRDDRTRAVLILVPASASGETARRSIEYAARGEPDDIYLFIGVSRMEPSHLSFLTTLTRYRSSRLHVEFFASFTIRGYQLGKTSCPICGELARLKLLRDAVHNDTELYRAVDEKFRALLPWPVDHASPSFFFAATLADQRRTQIRALYEAAEFDHAAQDAMSELLQHDAVTRDRFLEMVSLEHSTEHFDLPVLRRRLGTAVSAVMERVSEILWTAAPPFQLTTVIDALVHLDEQEFMRASGRLLQAFISSQLDLREICIALSDLRYWPALPNSFFEGLTDAPERSALIRATDEAIVVARTRTQGFPSLLRYLGRIRTVLGRSSHFYDRLERLAKRAGVDTVQLHQMSEDLYTAWSRELGANVAFATTHAQWRALCRRRERFSSSLQELSASVTRIRALGKSVGGEDAVTVGAQIAAVATEALKAAASFVDTMSDLVINPLNSTISAVPDEFMAQDGGLVKVDKIIDFDVPRVFCAMADLNDVVDELTSNWMKFKDRSDALVRLQVRAERGIVMISFGDNFTGRVDQSSHGGWRMAKQLCRDYGGDLRLQQRDDWKSIELQLQAVDQAANEED